MDSAPPFLVAIVGWLLPGAGYWLIGDLARGLIVGVTILVLFFGGILIAGMRVIDVPGYGPLGQKAILQPVENQPAKWKLTADPLGAVMEKPWYVTQILAGPVTIICSKLSLDAADRIHPYPQVKARLGEIGQLYTAVAGLLNLLAIIDAGQRAQHQEEPA